MNIKVSGLLIIAFTSMPVSAHEFWLEPSLFSVSPNSAIEADIRIGQRYNGYAYPYLEHEALTFHVRDDLGLRDVQAVTGDKPAYKSDLIDTGMRWVGFESDAYDIKFSNKKKLIGYLETEGLEWVIDWYEREGRSPEGMTETYYRHAKTLIRVSGAQEPSWIDEPLDHRFELIPSAGFTQCASDPEFQLLWEGQPISDILVRRLTKEESDTDALRTDEEGRVKFKAKEGIFLINAVRIDEGTHARAEGKDWYSDWASLTYECE